MTYALITAALAPVRAIAVAAPLALAVSGPTVAATLGIATGAPLAVFTGAIFEVEPSGFGMQRMAPDPGVSGFPGAMGGGGMAFDLSDPGNPQPGTGGFWVSDAADLTILSFDHVASGFTASTIESLVQRSGGMERYLVVYDVSVIAYSGNPVFDLREVGLDAVNQGSPSDTISWDVKVYK